MEPPPAATVSIARSGAAILTPALSASYSISKPPSQRLTSVLVPPMSKAIAQAQPASLATCAEPTTPPAGPLRTASLPLKRRGEQSPPALVSSRSEAEGAASAIEAT